MPQNFILEDIDVATNSTAARIRFAADAATLDRALDTAFAEGDSVQYDLSAAEADAVAQLCGVARVLPGAPARIGTSSRDDELSYQVHTNSELLLMLRGDKPLAAFLHDQFS